MCTTEIWTFRECGCTLHHHVSCPPRKRSEKKDDAEKHDWATASENQKNLLPQPGTLAQGWTPTRSPRMNNEPVGLALSPALEMQCSAVHTVHRQFLDPVCDECVTEEQKRKSRLSNITILDEHSPIWSSEIIIEVESQDCSFSPFSRPQSKRGSVKSEDVSPCRPSSRKRRSRRFSILQLRDRFITPSPSIGYGDDEESERGRSRRNSPVRELRELTRRPDSRTKEFRRRGVDLSRGDLRISSRWSSRERKSMEDFRETLREKARNRDAYEPEVAKQKSKQAPSWSTQSKDLKEKVVKGLRRGLSRSRSRHRSSIRADSNRARTLTPPPVPRSPFTSSNKSSDSLQIRGRQMPRSRSRSEYTLRTPRSSDDANVEIIPDDMFKEDFIPRKPSWDEQVQQDLSYQPKQEKKRHDLIVSSRRSSGSMPSGFRWSYQIQNSSTLDLTTVTQTRIGSPITRNEFTSTTYQTNPARALTRSPDTSSASEPKSSEIRGSTEFDAEHWWHEDIEWSPHYYNNISAIGGDVNASANVPASDFDENYLLNTIPKNHGPALLLSSTYRKRGSAPRSLSTKRSGTLASVPESREDIDMERAKSLSSTVSVNDDNSPEKSTVSSNRSDTNSNSCFYSARTSAQNSLHSVKERDDSENCAKNLDTGRDAEVISLDEDAFYESYDYDERTPTLPCTIKATTETFKLAAGANLVLSEMVASLRTMSDDDLPRKYY